MVDRDTFDAEQFARLCQESFSRFARESAQRSVVIVPSSLPWEHLPTWYRDLMIAAAAQVLDELDQAALLTVSRPRRGWGP